jgi:hypothetical protein
MKKNGKVDVPPLAERRPFARKRVLFGGVAVHPLRQGGANCQVRDISETGARITVARADTLPDRLHLIIMREQIAYYARVVWRSNEEAGLVFSKVIDLRAAPAPETSHLAAILARKRSDYVSWRSLE